MCSHDTSLGVICQELNWHFYCLLDQLFTFQINKSMIHYTYIINHKDSNKYYVGRHSTTNVDDNYMGSGKWVSSISDRNNLQKTIIEFYDNHDDLISAESILIESNISNPDCMNFNNNAVGFASGSLNPACSDEQRMRQSERLKQNHPMQGKRHTVESRQKMSESRKGKSTWNSGLTKETSESVAKISESNIGRTPWNKGKTGVQSPSMLGKSHTTEALAKMADHCKNRDYSGSNNPMYGKSAVKGRKWYVNESGNTIYTFPDDPTIDLTEYQRGRKWKSD